MVRDGTCSSLSRHPFTDLSPRRYLKPGAEGSMPSGQHESVYVMNSSAQAVRISPDWRL